MNPRLRTKVTACVSVNGHPPSIYGAIKREPTAQCLSTAEAVSYATSILQCGEGATIPSRVVPALQRLIDIQIAFRTERHAAAATKQQQQQQRDAAPKVATATETPLE